MNDIMGVIRGGGATIETPTVVKFVNSFTVLGRIQMVVQMKGSSYLQFHEQNLPYGDSDIAEVLLARLNSNGAYMIVKKVPRIEGYIYCDILRRMREEERDEKLLEFISNNVTVSGKSVRDAFSVFVPIEGHDQVRCAVNGAEKVWVVLDCKSVH
jgi:hypothetical protein